MTKHLIIVAGWFAVAPKDRDEVVEAHEDIVRRARRAPGCLDLAISRDPIDPGRINMFELWRSEEDLDSWRAVAKPPKEISPILTEDVQKHEVLKSGPPF